MNDRSSRHSKEGGHIIYDGFVALAAKIKDFTPQVLKIEDCWRLKNIEEECLKSLRKRALRALRALRVFVSHLRRVRRALKALKALEGS
jgi:hypothetical protein